MRILQTVGSADIPLNFSMSNPFILSTIPLCVFFGFMILLNLGYFREYRVNFCSSGMMENMCNLLISVDLGF
jgi:hypothetical protein